VTHAGHPRFHFMIMMRPKMLCRLNKKHHELENLLIHNHMIKIENPFEKVKEKPLSLFFCDCFKRWVKRWA